MAPSVVYAVVREEHLPALMELVHLCHPTRPAPCPEWFLAYPTIGAFTEDGVLIGYASFTINVVSEIVTLVGMDVGVHPDHRRLGISDQLYREYLRLGRIAGATQWLRLIGNGDTTLPPSMAKFGMRHVATLPGKFYDGRDALVFLGPITEGA